jgi:hypothetical protein
MYHLHAIQVVKLCFAAGTQHKAIRMMVMIRGTHDQSNKVRVTLWKVHARLMGEVVYFNQVTDFH